MAEVGNPVAVQATRTAAAETMNAIESAQAGEEGLGLGYNNAIGCICTTSVDCLFPLGVLVSALRADNWVRAKSRMLFDSTRQRIRIRFKARRLRHLISLRASEASVLNHVDRSRPLRASSDDLLIKHAKSFAVPICVVLLTECSWFKLNFETSEIARSAVRLLTLSELGQPDGLLFQ